MSLYAATHRPAGPSLLSAGQWTKGKLVAIRKATDGNCIRCIGNVAEALAHRHWSCPDDRIARVQLVSKLSRPTSVDTLMHNMPPRLSRCGILPREHNFSDIDYRFMLLYMQNVAKKATAALARHHRTLPPLETTEGVDWDADDISRTIVWRGPMPQLRTKKKRRPTDNPATALQWQRSLAEVPGSGPERTFIPNSCRNIRFSPTVRLLLQAYKPPLCRMGVRLHPP